MERGTFDLPSATTKKASSAASFASRARFAALSCVPRMTKDGFTFWVWGFGESTTGYQPFERASERASERKRERERER